jgi:hypothetical protein
MESTDKLLYGEQDGLDDVIRVINSFVTQQESSRYVHAPQTSTYIYIILLYEDARSSRSNTLGWSHNLPT